MRIISLIFCSLLGMGAYAQTAADGQAASPQGQLITLTTAIGTTLHGYVAGPPDASRGILLLHDRWGLNRAMRGEVEQFAQRGYRALAIDVFDGRASDDMDLATEIMNSTDPEWVKTDIVAGLSYLEAQGREIAAMGWGYGGWQSLHAGLANTQSVGAVIVWYGDMAMTFDEARLLRAPVLGLFGRHDQQITLDDVERYRQRFRKGFVLYDLQVFDAGHGFADPLYPTFNQQVAERAWNMVDRFLDEHL